MHTEARVASFAADATGAVVQIIGVVMNMVAYFVALMLSMSMVPQAFAADLGRSERPRYREHLSYPPERTYRTPHYREHRSYPPVRTYREPLTRSHASPRCLHCPPVYQPRVQTQCAHVTLHPTDWAYVVKHGESCWWATTSAGFRTRIFRSPTVKLCLPYGSPTFGYLGKATGRRYVLQF